MNVVIIRYAEEFEPHRIIDVTGKDVKEVIRDRFPNVTDMSEESFTADDPKYDGEKLRYSYDMGQVEH